MRTIQILAVFLCLMSTFSVQVNAQLIIRNNGHAEVGHDPFDPVPEGLNPNYYNWLDTTTVLKIFGKYGDNAAGGHMSFGDNLLWNQYNVAVGELGYTDTDRLWLQGKNGAYLTSGISACDTIMYYDTHRSSAVNFTKDVQTSGLFVQSDERFKDNIAPVEDVLSSLGSLEAVTYTLKRNSEKNLDAVASMPIMTDKDRKDKAFYERFYAENAKGSERYGFLAQNVQRVFPELVHTDQSGYMYVDYIGLIPILVQSINELQARIDELEQQKDADTPLLAAVQAGQGDLEAKQTQAKLYQNAPNPWSSETVIRYCLPQSVAQACIYIYDMQGTQIKSISANGRGESQVTLTARDLKAGMYLYALVADGNLIESKQMILTK